MEKDSGRGTSRDLFAFCILAGLLVSCCSCDPVASRYTSPLVPLAGGEWSGVAALTAQPNIILINLDDADRESLEIDFAGPGMAERFPGLTRLGREGLRFVNFHAAVPICGPSRACLLTGQYAYKTGIRCNSPGAQWSRGVGGGYLPYRNSGPFGSKRQPPYRDDDLAVWMQDAGYHTMLVGKYLHDDFVPQAGEDWNAVYPVGWDEFYATLGGRYFNYLCVQNGKLAFAKDLDPRRYPNTYRTARESVDAQELVRNHLATSSAPFFLYLAPFAPHVEEPSERCVTEDVEGRGMVEPAYRGEWLDMLPPPAPDFDEADISDKPLTMQQLPRLDRVGDTYQTDDRIRTETEYRRRMRSLRSVDDMLGDLFETLESGAAMGNTLVILTSDHGYQLGHQRHFGKGTPYNRATNSPLFIWGPGYVAPNPEPQTHLLSQIDLAPTLVEIAGAPPRNQVQGKSFVPLLARDNGIDPRDWRPEGILIEHWEQIVDTGGILNTTFQSLRLHDSVYTEWSTGECEYYDLAGDPRQLENGIGSLSAPRREILQQQLRDLKSEMPAPVCFVESPMNGNETYFGKAALRGLAEHPAGIQEVRLVITEIGDSAAFRYWNGQEWSDERVTLKAELASSRTVVTDWSYTFSPPLEKEGRFKVVARAIANGGIVAEETVNTDFSIDTAMPVTHIQAPAPGKTLKGSSGIQFRGESIDPAGINSVRIVIVDRDRKLFWNGTGWQTERVSMKAAITLWQPQKAVWKFDFQPPEPQGTAQILVTAVNGKFEHDQPARSMRFSWDR